MHNQRGDVLRKSEDDDARGANTSSNRLETTVGHATRDGPVFVLQAIERGLHPRQRIVSHKNAIEMGAQLAADLVVEVLEAMITIGCMLCGEGCQRTGGRKVDDHWHDE